MFWFWLDQSYHTILYRQFWLFPGHGKVDVERGRSEYIDGPLLNLKYLFQSGSAGKLARASESSVQNCNDRPPLFGSCIQYMIFIYSHYHLFLHSRAIEGYRSGESTRPPPMFVRARFLDMGRVCCPYSEVTRFSLLLKKVDISITFPNSNIERWPENEAYGLSSQQETFSK